MQRKTTKKQRGNQAGKKTNKSKIEVKNRREETLSNSRVNKKATKKPPEKAAKNSKVKNLEEESSLFKFRRYKKLEGGKGKKAKHPKLIVEKTETEYGFMGMTEEAKSGHHKNMPIKNPKKGDKRKSYLRKELRYDIQENFEEILKNYKLSEKDKKAVIEFIEKKRKKKK